MIKFEEADGQKRLTYIARSKEINLAHPESQFMFRRLVEKGYSGIFMADILGYLFYVNHAFVGMLSYDTKDDIIGMNLADVVFKDPDKRGVFLKKLNSIGFVQDYELDLVRHDGLDVVLSVTASTIESSEGTVIGIEGFVHDMTERSNFDDILISEKQKLEQILEFEEVISAIKEFDELVECVVERLTKVLDAQKCSIMLLDAEKKTLKVAGAKGISNLIVKNARIELGEPIAGVVAGEGQPLLVKNIEYDKKFQRANRPTYFGRSFMIVPMKLEDKVVGVINVSDKIIRKALHKGSRLNYEETFTAIDLRILCAVAREVSVALGNIELFKELNSLAVTDPLVHIYNYRQFSKSLDYEIKRSRRTESSLCVIMIDVDDFKSYNDTFGHPEGDNLLRHLGQIFKSQLREVDIVCRYAGDEFTIILPDTNIDGARRAAEKIKEAVEKFSFKKPVTLSIGLASYTSDISQHELIVNVDKALYRAKKEGKNRIWVDASV
jgi:diguanylate cyclase (GGDEF)-like protein/PAS domain S-box-containing protein